MSKKTEEIEEIIEKNQEDYLEDRPLKLRCEVDLSLFKDYPAFLEWLILEGMHENDTVYVDGVYTEYEKDKQCRPKANRSTRDIFVISRFYFPDLQLEDLLVHLLTLQYTCKIRSLHCPDIKRRTWYKNIDWDYLPARKNMVFSEENDMEFDRRIEAFSTETDNLSYNDIKIFYEYKANKENKHNNKLAEASC